MFFPQNISLQIVSYPTEADDSHAKEIRPKLVPQTVSCSVQFHRCSDLMVFSCEAFTNICDVSKLIFWDSL